MGGESGATQEALWASARLSSVQAYLYRGFAQRGRLGHGQLCGKKCNHVRTDGLNNYLAGIVMTAVSRPRNLVRHGDSVAAVFLPLPLAKTVAAAAWPQGGGAGPRRAN